MPIFGSLGTTEWIIIGVVIFLLFGGKKLTELARGLGESGKELKRVKKEFTTAVEDEKKEIELDEMPEDKPQKSRSKKA